MLVATARPSQMRRHVHVMLELSFNPRVRRYGCQLRGHGAPFPHQVLGIIDVAEHYIGIPQAICTVETSQCLWMYVCRHLKAADYVRMNTAAVPATSLQANGEERFCNYDDFKAPQQITRCSALPLRTAWARSLTIDTPLQVHVRDMAEQALRTDLKSLKKSFVFVAACVETVDSHICFAGQAWDG